MQVSSQVQFVSILYILIRIFLQTDLTHPLLMHRTHSTYGRLVAKPVRPGDEDDEEEEEQNVTVQDQIENLKVKIALKQRYNRVVAEELRETLKGNRSLAVLQDIYYETRDLRLKLMDALVAEQFAVQNAFRSHRLFQLAMRDHGVGRALPWLEDKLFDAKKKLNALLDRLKVKRGRLEDAEQMVILIEKCPRPGTLQWEIEASLGFEGLENAIETFNIKKETAIILSTKYATIRSLLREERNKYAPLIRDLGVQLEVLKVESDSLKMMQAEAKLFHDDVEKDLVLTEQEASENRKYRRKQMAKIRQSVEMVLAENELAHQRKRDGGKIPAADKPEGSKDKDLQPAASQMSVASSTEAPAHRLGTRGRFFHSDSLKQKPETILDLIFARKEDVAHFQYQARRLVDAMKVSDLTFIPGRLQAVKLLGEKLHAEIESKLRLRLMLLKHKNQLTLVQCHFKWTGQKADREFGTRRQEYDDALRAQDEDYEEANRKLQYVGDVSVNLRMSTMALLERLDPERETKSRRPGFQEPALKTQLKVVADKVRKLVHVVEGLRAEVQNLGPPVRNYAQFVRAPTIPERLIRAGSPEHSDESEEEELPDSRVPTNRDIKMKSHQTVQQAILKRGLS